jgi:hypothetical protein
VESLDLDVRRLVYLHVAATGRAPTVDEVAPWLGRGPHEIAACYRRLHDAHAFVLFPGSLDIWAANPFCFGETPHRVTAGARVWTATCAWDALGIPAALRADGVVESSCACCGEELTLEVRRGELVQGDELVAHFVVPAARWWDDIRFT